MLSPAEEAFCNELMSNNTNTCEEEILQQAGARKEDSASQRCLRKMEINFKEQAMLTCCLW